MTSRHALLPAVTAAVVLVLAIVLPFAGCGLPLQGLSTEPDGGTPCDNDNQCVDMNPCSVDSCVAGACNHAMQPDGPAPSAAQTAFDCKVVQCVNGAPAVKNDDGDVQADSEDCTVDQCNEGQAFHTAKPDDTSCTMGGDGICKGGKCQILCTVDAMCDDKNPCTVDSCDMAQGLCGFAPLNGVNTPGVSQIDFDCNVQVCVDGVDTKSPDDSDLPKTATDCDEELCNNGVATNPPLALDVTCGTAKDMLCDGAGSCVQCNSPTQCPGVDNDCQARSCAGHVCGITYSPLGTPRAAPFQMPGDCKVVVCDGAGSSAAQLQNDDTDLPVDGNKCTMDVCTAGVISHPFEAINTACGNNSACNATGQCGCANDTACMVPNTCGGGNPGTAFICGCTLKSCATLGKTCGAVTDGCFSTQNCDNSAKDGSETDVDCGGGGACGDTCAQGKQCSVDGDCATGHCADGVCCNTACTGTCLACTTAKKGNGLDGTCGSVALGLQDPNATTTCVGTKVCDGANNCKKIDGQTCTLNSECVNGSCADGFCCNTACSGTCQACSAVKTGGTDGVCGNVLVNQQDSVATTPCINNNACDGSGVCKTKLGQGCASNSTCANGNCVDGVCCGVVGGCAACQSCAIGANGTCGNLPAGQDTVTPNTCSGTSTCDGLGNCKKANGQTCGATSECATGTCVDGVCCGVASCPACKSCALGANGTCGNIVAGTPDTATPGTCTGSNTCDGAGGCKKINGQVCGATSECATGTCIDGVCCGVASCPVCQSCALGGGGTCGDILSGMLDTTAPNTCMGTSQCDGSGACKAINGQACVTTTDCAVGSCVDGVCCGVSSCPACQSCALGATPGTCGNIADGMPDTATPNTCTGGNLCQGGACKAPLGQPCPGGLASNCQSGFCADTVCCNVACTAAAVCMSCNGTMPGTCSAVTTADDADSCPVATKSCDSAGACLLRSTQPCTLGTECASGMCNGQPGSKTCQ